MDLEVVLIGNMTKLTSPLFVMLPRKTKADKRVALNLNVYRNLHYLVNNQAKQIYNELMSPQLSGLVFDKPIKITFVLYKRDKRRIDRANILSIVEKFFCDAMVKNGCLIDDNDDYILETVYRTGGIDKNDPRVDITIEY